MREGTYPSHREAVNNEQSSPRAGATRAPKDQRLRAEASLEGHSDQRPRAEASLEGTSDQRPSG